MRSARTFFYTASALLLASPAFAADQEVAPGPSAAPSQERITPENNTDSSILTTHKNASEPAPKAAPVAAPDATLPWASPTSPAPVTPGAPAAPVGSYQPKMPFGRGETPAPIIPEGPHTTVSVPVVDVQSLEAPEAAPPTPVTVDPSKENPEDPTELTSPIFGDSDNKALPRKIVLRLLNKVTAQSTILTFKPGETVKVGQMEITAITCQISAPQSQTDYAALLDIFERSATAKTVKPLFRGWMYASSPSITALEHPVYDVTMVKCETPEPAVKKEEKSAEKPAKKGKK